MTNKLHITDLSPDVAGAMEGRRPPRSFASDGCTCAPDFLFGCDLRAACLFHDWAYLCGGDERDRQRADQAFYRNLIRCGLSPTAAGVYYRRVRLEGLALFAFHEPPSRLARLRLYCTVFFTRCFPVPMTNERRGEV